MALGGTLSFWDKQKKRILAKNLENSIHLARCNPDYQLLHPNECRENPEHHVLSQCHPEAHKRICHQYETFLQKSLMPKPKYIQERFNKNG